MSYLKNCVCVVTHILKKQAREAINQNIIRIL